MCGRYYVADDDLDDEIRAVVEAINRKTLRDNETIGMEKSTSTAILGEIFPTNTVPVIANNKTMKPTPFSMKWGYTLPGGRPIINARSETAVAKPMFKDGMANRRCLIPASYYFEWEKTGPQKTKYAIAKTNKLIYLAGIYRFEPDTQSPVFTILTRPAATGISFIHDRMPVILSSDLRDEWLSPKSDPQKLINAAVTDIEYWAV